MKQFFLALCLLSVFSIGCMESGTVSSETNPADPGEDAASGANLDNASE